MTEIYLAEAYESRTSTRNHSSMSGAGGDTGIQSGGQASLGEDQADSLRLF